MFLCSLMMIIINYTFLASCGSNLKNILQTLQDTFMYYFRTTIVSTLICVLYKLVKCHVFKLHFMK